MCVLKKIILTITLLSLILLTSCNEYAEFKDTYQYTPQTQQQEIIQTDKNHTDCFIVNKKTKKFHYRDCYYVTQMNEENKICFYGSFEKAEELGYSHCYFCGE